MKEFVIEASDGLLLSTALFEHPDPEAAVHLVHGSAEHKERYYAFARFLNRAGFAVIIADNRGHGASVNDHYKLGIMDGIPIMMDDLSRINDYAHACFPSKKVFMLGHSLGSVLARCYLQTRDDTIDKLVLSGMVAYNLLTPLGIRLTKLDIALRGEDANNPLLRHFVMNAGNISWISQSHENIAAYHKDPLCGFAYPDCSVLTILQGVRELDEPHLYQCLHPELPILSISGADDPVTGGDTGLKRSFRLLSKAGYSRFENIIYSGMRHEVLNEAHSEDVFRDVIAFFRHP